MTMIQGLAALATGLTAFALPASAHEGRTQDKPRVTTPAEPMPFGRAADPARAQRVVKIGMDDNMRYSPDRLVVKRGETVRLVVTNHGRQMHEIVLGTRKELERHAEMMRKHPGMEHDEPHMLHVAPGKTGEMGWQFTKAGEFHYACLLPGHFEAGMVGKVTVIDK